MTTASCSTRWSRGVTVIFLALCLAGCATQKIDWNARVGSYTFDQAVAELGPPDRSARLTDGSTVAEWLTARGASTAYVNSGFGLYEPVHGPRGGVYAGPAIVNVSPAPDYFVRLTFGADGQLLTWKKTSR